MTHSLATFINVVSASAKMQSPLFGFRSAHIFMNSFRTVGKRTKADGGDAATMFADNLQTDVEYAVNFESGADFAICTAAITDLHIDVDCF